MTSDSQSVLSVSGCMRVVGNLVLLMTVVLVALFIVAKEVVEQVANWIGEKFESLTEAVASIPQSVATAVSDAFRNETRARMETKLLLAETINTMGTLVTASHPGDANVTVGIRSGLFNLCGLSVDHDVTGTIEAGVDLAQVSSGDFIHDILTNSWVLRLGSAKIHSCRIDYIAQLGNTGTICRQDWDEYRMLAEVDALTKIRDEALVEGLLAKAEQEAQQVLGNFMSAVTGSDNITIVFESEPVTEFPESCLRELPTEWKFDEESDSWVRE